MMKSYGMNLSMDHIFFFLIFLDVFKLSIQVID